MPNAREHLNSLWPGLVAGDPKAIAETGDALALWLPILFEPYYILGPEIEALVLRLITPIAVGAPKTLAPGTDFYDWVEQVALGGLRTWLHDLQRRGREWHSVRKLQARLLEAVDSVAVEGIEIASGHRPAREMTGDLCQAWDLGNGFALLVLGDAEGKGPAAAYYGAVVMGCLLSLRAHLMHPGEILEAVNALLPGLNVRRSAALTVVLWNGRTRELTFAGAGSPSPLYCRDGAVLPVVVSGCVAGLLDGATYETRTMQARANDVVILASDGLTDQENPAGDPYGPERLADLASTLGDLPCAEIVIATLDDVGRFAAGAAQGDDQTVVAIRVKPAT